MTRLRVSKTCPATGRFCTTIIALLGVMAFSGCGSSSDKKETAPVSGVVTYEGRPVVTGTIMFTPLEGGRPATGELQVDGSYVLQTYGEADGAILGEHKVTITSLNLGGGLPEDAVSEPIPLIPEKYFNDTTSGLTATVREGENSISFDLVDE